jgi:hypothetical protein
MRRWIFGLSSVMFTTALVMACSVGTDCDFGLCAGPTAGGGEGGGGDGGVDGEGGVKPPDGCDATKEPKDSPKCVSSDFGIFVSPKGTPNGTGKIDSPVNTIAAGLAKTGAIRRLYICDGAYAEHVVLKSAVSLYGGFNCDTWVHDDTIKPVVGKITESGYGLDVQTVSGSFNIFDLEFGAGNGDDAFPNSIAARFVGTSGATLRRVKLTARDGLPGKKGDLGVAGSTVNHTDFTGTMSPFSADGNPGTMAGPGAVKTCKCANAPTAEVTTGGSGGGGGGGAGQKGDPASLPPTGPDDGSGGTGNASCASGGTGHNGATRAQAAGGPVATRLGALSNAEWKSEAGGDGATALLGQGGGGGTGESTGAGSGGACGGCGGFGGKAGTGGGASLAVLAVSSPIRVSGELVTGKGGRGGDGGDGGDGGLGGTGGRSSSGNGCNGGDGGTGGKGGAASGGAGGLSVGILTSGAGPITDGATFTLGSFGDGGTGLSSNSGPPGIKANSASVENVSTKTTM